MGKRSLIAQVEINTGEVFRLVVGSVMESIFALMGSIMGLRLVLVSTQGSVTTAVTIKTIQTKRNSFGVFVLLREFNSGRMRANMTRWTGLSQARSRSSQDVSNLANTRSTHLSGTGIHRSIRLKDLQSLTTFSSLFGR